MIFKKIIQDEKDQSCNMSFNCGVNTHTTSIIKLKGNERQYILGRGLGRDQITNLTESKFIFDSVKFGVDALC